MATIITMNKQLPKFDKSVSLVTWAYNEAESIEDFLRRADALMADSVEDYEIVVVDDGSVDGTPDIVRSLAGELPKVRLLVNDRNRNVAYSCRRAIGAAEKEYLFWQTADWSYDISRLREFLEQLKTHDVVAGVRRAPVRQRAGVNRAIAGLYQLVSKRHLTKRSDTVSKAIVSICNYLLIRVLFGLPLSDYQNVVIYPTKWVQAITMEADSSFANPELLMKSYWQGARIAEVPISFIPRTAGEAKGTKFTSILRSIRDVFGFWFKWVVLGGRGEVKKGTVTRLNPSKWEIGQ